MPRYFGLRPVRAPGAVHNGGEDHGGANPPLARRTNHTIRATIPISASSRMNGARNIPGCHPDS